MSGITNATDLFCGAVIANDLLVWNITVEDIWWKTDFFAPCTEYVLFPFGLFIISIFLYILGCLSRVGASVGKASSGNAKLVDVEFCITDNSRYWGAVMVLVSWPVFLAHGMMNEVADLSVFGDEVIGATFIFLSVAFMLADQTAGVKLGWRAHKKEHPKAEAGCVSPTSARHIVFWLLALIVIGMPLLRYREPSAQVVHFEAGFSFWSVTIRTALVLFTLIWNAVAGPYLKTGTDVLKLAKRPKKGSKSTSTQRRKATTTGSELQDPLLPTSTDVATTADDDDDAVRSPEEDAWFVSKGWFSWLNPIMRVGSRRPLTQEDLYPVHHSDSSEVRMSPGSSTEIVAATAQMWWRSDH